MAANYFESPARPCHSVMGNVIGLFANRAQRGIVLLEAFSVSQRLPLSPTPFEGSHAWNIFATKWLREFLPCFPKFAFLKAGVSDPCTVAHTGVEGGKVIIKGPSI